MQFEHEKFDVYNLAIDFVGLADNVVEKFPKGRAYLTDQLLRASTSIPLNIAEGSGRISKGSKKNFYSISQASATECAAIFDVCNRLKIIKQEQYNNGKEMLSRISLLLTNLMKSVK
jgi:four helix bundle protein